MKEIVLNVEGIECQGCEKRIQNAISSIEGVKKVIASHENGTVIIEADNNLKEDVVKQIIVDLGFGLLFKL